MLDFHVWDLVVSSVFKFCNLFNDWDCLLLKGNCPLFNLNAHHWILQIFSDIYVWCSVYENVSEFQGWEFPSDFLMQSLSFILEHYFFCCCDRPACYGISFSAALSVDFVLVLFWRVVVVWWFGFVFFGIVTITCFYCEAPTCKSTFMSDQSPVSTLVLG